MAATAPQITRPDFLGLSAAGAGEGVVYLDSLTMKHVDGDQTDWPLQLDFEDELLPGNVIGADEEKGATISPTDKHAVGGKQSLALQNRAIGGWRKEQ